MQWNVLKRNWS